MKSEPTDFEVVEMQLQPHLMIIVAHPLQRTDQLITVHPCRRERRNRFDELSRRHCVSVKVLTRSLDCQASALYVKLHLRCPIQICQLCLSFYPRPNISDRFLSHFIHIQIFQIDFPLTLYL